MLPFKRYAQLKEPARETPLFSPQSTFVLDVHSAFL
jgi:hypothetical protein